MTEAILKTGLVETEAVDSGVQRRNLSHEEWLDFGARMAARGVTEKRWENTGISMEQAIDALRVAVEENLCASLDLDPS